MATENERKYVLFNEPYVLYQIATKANKILTIEQAYLHFNNIWNIRIRKTFGVHYDTPIYHYTFKQKIKNRIIELEQSIDERDYNDLLTIAKQILYKTRYVIPVGIFNWEIDFFYDFKHTTPYFVMAEIELPEGTTNPPTIPDFIYNNLLYEVQKNNNDFSSLKLSQIDYALAKYDELIKENNE